MHVFVTINDPEHGRSVRIAMSPENLTAFLPAALAEIEASARLGVPVEFKVPNAGGAWLPVVFHDPRRAFEWVQSLTKAAGELVDNYKRAQEAQRRRNAVMAAAGASPLAKVDQVLKDANGDITGMRTEYVY